MPRLQPPAQTAIGAMRQTPPDNYSKYHETEASNGCSCCIRTCYLSCAKDSCLPARSFFCFSCFSNRVAVAGKIAGNARNSPPTPGPSRLAMIPASAVTNPPKAKRRRYSYHFERPRAEILISIFMNQFIARTRAPTKRQAREAVPRP